MLFFDVAYILCCNFYKKREANIFKISGLILLSFVFLTDMMLVTFMLTEFFSETFGSDYFYTRRYYIDLGAIPVFLFILYLRYFKITNYDEVVKKMYSLTPNKRNTYCIIALVYIVLSIGSLLIYVF